MPSQWNVHCQSVGRGEESLQYLARYLYRGVISEHRILTCQNGLVEFEYLCSKTKRYQRLTLPAAQFLWKVLMHVLPRGFQRARCYGVPASQLPSAVKAHSADVAGRVARGKQRYRQDSDGNLSWL